MAETIPRMIAVVGPTAVGKSALAVRLARRFSGEIVSVDSAQVYRGLDAATSKPARSERGGIPHHLIDVADPHADFSAGDFARLAGAAIEEMARRGLRAVLAGGTGLYFRALLQGLADMPKRDPAIRGALERWAATRDSMALHRMLSQLDPPTAARLGPRDTQRIVRALEVIFQTGRSLSALIAIRPFDADRYPVVKIGLSMPAALLDSRIDARVDTFFEAGLVEEVRALLAAGVPPRANAFKALGYREVLAHVTGGVSLPETRALVKQRTRRYARRQRSWFRREPGIVWHQLGERPEESHDGIEADVARRLDATEESRDGNR